MKKVEFLADSIDDTNRLALALSEVVELGDLVIMDGDLGTGKTTFVKAFVAALGSENDVTSPTYAIANFYELPKGSFLHIDAYRLSSMDEFHDLGLYDFLEDSITAIEWGKRVQEDFQTYLMMEIKLSGADFEKRIFQFSAIGEKYQNKLETLGGKLQKNL